MSTVYYDANGRIVGVAQLQEDMEEANCPPGMSWMNTSSNATCDRHYVLEGEITERPLMSLVVGATEFSTEENITISGVPVGAVFSHPGGEESITDGEVEWSSALSGRYLLQVTCFPYKEESIYVQVNPL